MLRLGEAILQKCWLKFDPWQFILSDHPGFIIRDQRIARSERRDDVAPVSYFAFLKIAPSWSCSLFVPRYLINRAELVAPESNVARATCSPSRTYFTGVISIRSRLSSFPGIVRWINHVSGKTLTLTFGDCKADTELDIRVDELFAAADVRSNDTRDQPWRALSPKWPSEVLGRHHKYTSDARKG